MAVTQIDLDRFAKSKTFAFGDTSATGQAAVTIHKGTSATSVVGLDVKNSVNIAGDLNLIGNLNITGSIDEQSVTNLAVKDVNITINKGGTTAGGAGAGLLVEGTSGAVIGGITFNNALASKFGIGDGTTQREIADVSSSQAFTNKAIAIASNTFTGGFSVSNGGTGQTTLTANNLLVGNGTSGINFIAPSTAGNILTSNGTAWVSSTPVAVTAFKRTSVSGTQNGVNTTFTLSNALLTNSDLVMIGSVPLIYGSGNDYTISGTTLTFAGTTIPLSVDVITVYGVY